MNLFTKETGFKVWFANLWLPKGECGGRDKSRAWNKHIHTRYKIDSQQGPTV